MTTVAEIQGLYGPLTVAESLIQKIWRDGNFDRDGLRTDCGRLLRIRHPGVWNPAGEGPDFKGASLEIDGHTLEGDVEVHFYSRDWILHGHDSDPAFSAVVLHVTLFPPDTDTGIRVKTSCGTTPASLALLDRLHFDIEEYASQDALQRLSGLSTDPLADYFAHKPLLERRAEVLRNARSRYRQKLAYTAQRIHTQGWDNACHQLFLEALGYRRNRAPMGELALRYSPGQMLATSLDELMAAVAGRWRLAALRPANHPRRRLQQYLQMLGENLRWPSLLLEFGLALPPPPPALDTPAFRRAAGIADLRRTFQEGLMADAISGSRLDTLMADVCLPLLAARLNRDLFSYWYHWYAGDTPKALVQFQRKCGLTDRSHPSCNGMNQGIWLIFLQGGLA